MQKWFTNSKNQFAFFKYTWNGLDKEEGYLNLAHPV